MKWVVVAIAVFIAGYTYVNLKYRRPTSFEPYEDYRERARIARVGYSRVSLSVSQPADGRIAPAPTDPVPGGLPADLHASLIDQPILPYAIGAVEAAPSLDRSQPYLVRFACSEPDAHRQLGSAHLYDKNGVLWLVVGFAPVSGELAARDLRTEVLLRVPGNSLPSGTYRVILVATRGSRAWSLQVH